MDCLKLNFEIHRSICVRTCALAIITGLLGSAGCGTTRDKMATDQLLLSDAVDRAVAHIDFSPLQGETVFLDTQFIRQVKGTGFVNADYIISSLRQQMVLAGCLLQEDRDEATFIVEPRVGALGADGHDVNYGVPASQGLNAAASIVTATPPLPTLPEISLARTTDDLAAAKIAVFAYHRETRQRVWQSGLSVARSTARGRWIFGAGPFQSGSIYGEELPAANPLDFKDGTQEGTLPEEDQAYRTAAVWADEIRGKLAPDKVRHLASLPEERVPSAPKSDGEAPPATR